MRFDHWSFYWVIILAILSVRAILRPGRFAYLLPLAYLWTADVRLGLSWSGFKVVTFAYMASIVVSRLLPPGRAIPRRARLVLLVLYVLGVSLFGVLSVPPDIPFLSLLYSDVQRPPYRQILQVVFWVASMLCLFMAFRGISNADDFARCLRVIFVSVAVAAIMGIVLFTLFMFAPAVSRLLASFVSYLVNTQFRVAPFSYEPRYYGRAMSIATCLTILCRAFPLGGVPSWVSKHWVTLTLILLTLLTASVATAGAAALGWVAVFAWLILRREPATRLAAKASRRYSKGQIIAFSILAIVLIRLLWLNVPLLRERVDWYLGASGIYVSGFSVDFRMIEEGRYDWNAYMRWLAREPEYLAFGAGLGSSAFRAYPYLSSTSPWVRGGGILSSRLPFLNRLGDIGLIGMSMMFLLFYLWWRDLGRIAEKCPSQQYHAIQICRGMVVFLVASSLFQDTFALVWFFLGAGFGCGSVCGIDRDTEETLTQSRLVRRSPASMNSMGA